MTNDILERDVWTDIFAKLYLTSLRQMVTILLLPSKLFTASDDVCKHTEQQFVSKYHYRENIFLHRFTIFKKIITSSLSLDLTIFNIPRYQDLQQFLGRSRKKTKKKQKIEESTTSYEILNKISNKKILIPKQSKRIHVKERKNSNWQNNSKKLVESRREIGSSRMRRNKITRISWNKVPRIDDPLVKRYRA